MNQKTSKDKAFGGVCILFEGLGGAPAGVGARVITERATPADTLNPKP